MESSARSDVGQNIVCNEVFLPEDSSAHATRQDGRRNAGPEHCSVLYILYADTHSFYSENKVMSRYNYCCRSPFTYVLLYIRYKYI